MKKVVQIDIDLYDLLGYGDFIYNIFLMDKKYHKITSDKLQIIYINLNYLRKISYAEVRKLNNKLMEDLYFLICGENLLETIKENGDKLMKDVINEAKQIAAIDQMDLYLTEEEMKENDKNHYLEVGREETKREMVISFYNNGASLELISKSTNLSIKQVRIIKISFFLSISVKIIYFF